MAASPKQGAGAAPPLLAGGEDMLPHNRPSKKYTEGRTYKKQKATSGNSNKATHKVPIKGQYNPEPKVMVLNAKSGAVRMVRV